MTINTIIIGAGMAGLIAARQLQDNGISYMLIEKEPIVGGRLATVVIDDVGFADVGAQFFTALGEEFKEQVELWQKEDLAYEIGTEWTDGSIRRFFADGDTRYAIKQGMASLANFLASDLQSLHLESEVVSINWVDDHWQVFLSDNSLVSSKNLIVSVPPPIATKLLWDVQLSADTLAEVNRLHYQPNLTAVFVIKGKSNLPESGGLQFAKKDSILRWIFDNKSKDPSQATPIITVQANRLWSKHNFEREAEDILHDMREALEVYLDNDAEIVQSILKRWQFGGALTTYPHPILKDENLPLIFAGDAFGGQGRLEGAYLSGLIAGQTIVKSNRVTS